jgi:hypothetical protein
MLRGPPNAELEPAKAGFGKPLPNTLRETVAGGSINTFSSMEPRGRKINNSQSS